MSTFKIVLFGAIVCLAPAFAGIGDSIPPANTVDESKALLQQRKNYLINYYANQEIGEWGGSHNSFALPLLAKLKAKQEVEKINYLFMDPELVPYAKNGTDITVIPGLCERKGDYDFMLQNLVRIIYEGRENSTLWPQTQFRMLHTLLNAKGGKHYKWFSLGFCGQHKDTENHILMIETSRYLTNQLLLKDNFTPPWEKDLYDNAKLGFHDWMLEHLQTFFLHHFEEYNSKPYQGYTIFTISNLANYAEEPRVKLAAQMLLDYLSAFFAVQSHGLRRITPFRRQPQYRNDTKTHTRDGQAAIHAILSGNYHYLENLDWKIPYGKHFALAFAVGDYEVPDLIQDLIIEKGHNKYLQFFKHDTPEIYFGSPSFLIGGGGVYRNFLDYGTKQQDGWARPITLMPADKSDDFSHWIRINGHKKEKRRANTCIGRNFACGINPVIPDSIPQSCQEKVGDFTFFNFSKSACPIRWDFHVAVMKKSCRKWSCKRAGKSYGFFEVQEANEISYQDFKRNILRYNHKVKFRFEGKNGYLNAKGELTVFEFKPKKWTYPIYSQNGQRYSRKIKKWPLAQGDVMEANQGKIIIKNHYLRKRLTLDMSKPLSPRKLEEEL